MDSVASLTRKPKLEPAYIAWTWLVTVHEIQALAATVDAVAGVPVVPGWLVQVTPVSVYAAAAW